MKELTIQLCNVTNKGYVVDNEVTIDYVGVGESYSHKKGGGFDLFDTSFNVNIKNGHVQDLVVYKEDKVIDLKQKIQLIFNLPIYRQYLFPTPFEMTIYGKKRENNIADLYSIDTIINDIPIDMYCYNNSNGIVVKAMDYFMRVEDLLNLGRGYTIKVVDINSIFHDLSNVEYKDHIYYGFVIKYFPMITREVYDDFLVGKNMSNYDRLNPNNEFLYDVYSGEQSLNDQLSKIKPVKFTTYVRSAVAQVEGRTRIDLLRLFGEMHIDESIILLSYRTRSGNILTKTNKKHSQNIRIKKNELIILFTDDNTSFIMRLYPTGYYRIEAKWNNLELDFSKLTKIFQKSVNPVIHRLNGFGRPIFQDYFKLKEINKFNSSISSLLLDIYWRHGKYFSDIEEELEEMLSTQVFTKTLEKDEDKKYKNKYIFNKGVVYDYFPLSEVGFNNDYNYATDIRAYQLWEKKLVGRDILITNRLSDMKIEVDNIKQNEYELLLKYLTLFANRLEKKPKSLETPKVRLKKLKEYDPITFDLKQYGTSLLYSKLCQQKFQPIIYSEDEVNNMLEKQKAKLIKYHNYTTNEPAWYGCDSKEVPYLHFITGKHPKGICLPCCKKTPPDRTKKSKEIYDACLEGRLIEYQEEKVQRYVMTYGKIMEPRRIGSLPTHFIKYFSMIYPNKVQSYYMYGVQQSEKQGYGTLPILSFLLNKEVPEIVNDIYNYTKEHNDIFLYSYGSNLSSYFNGVEDFLSNIIEFKQDTLVENAKFNDWNRLFLELAEYIFGVNFIIFNDLRTPGSNDDFDFEIELLKPYFNITGKFAIIFHYSVYSPIVSVEPNKFFNKGVINEKMYEYDDPIIKVMESMLKVQKEISEVDYTLIRDVVEEKKYEIVHHYINARKMLYAVLINTPEGKVYFPIELEPSNMLTNDVTIPTNLPYSALSSFIDDINVTIDQKYSGKYRKIEMNRLLVRDKDVVGFYFDQNYYFDSIKVNDITMEATMLSYDPNHVNKSIIEYLKNPTMEDNSEYESLFKEVHEYDLFVMEFLDKIDKKINKKVRKQVIDLLNNKYYKELSTLVGEDSQDIIRLHTDNDEENFTAKFNTQRYGFDAKVLDSYFELGKDKLVHKLVKLMGVNNQLIRMLAEDISNPAKRKHLQNLANLDYDLEVYPGETIFII
jgi:hypothetical protein